MKSEFDEKQWKACWQMTVEQRSARNVAGELGITENQAYLAKSRILKRLRKEFADILD